MVHWEDDAQDHDRGKVFALEDHGDGVRVLADPTIVVPVVGVVQVEQLLIWEEPQRNLLRPPFS